MPGLCKSAYGMGVLALPIGVVGEPIAAVINGEIGLMEIPGRIKVIVQEFWEMTQNPVGKCPALFPPAGTLIID